MRTVTLKEPGHFSQADVDDPTNPDPGEVLIGIKKIGVCGTDLHAFRGRQPFFSYPRILGHELGIEVLKCGEGVTLSEGQYCAVEPYLYCGQCIACRRGKTNCCEKLEVLGVHVDGGMREQMIVPAKNLYPSEKLHPEQLALVETLGIGAHAVERSSLAQDDTILVLGVGPIGLSVVQFAQMHGLQLIVADMNTRRLQFCQQNMKVSAVLDAGQDDFEAQLRRLLGGELPTVIFDATGNPESMQQAINYLSPGGKLILVGLYQGDYTFHDPLFHKKEVTLMSSRNSTGSNFRHIISLMEKGEIDTQPWITHHLGLDQVVQDFPSLLEPTAGLVKAMISV